MREAPELNHPIVVARQPGRLGGAHRLVEAQKVVRHWCHQNEATEDEL